MLGLQAHTTRPGICCFADQDQNLWNGRQKCYSYIQYTQSRPHAPQQMTNTKQTCDIFGGSLSYNVVTGHFFFNLTIPSHIRYGFQVCVFVKVLCVNMCFSVSVYVSPALSLGSFSSVPLLCFLVSYSIVIFNDFY